MAVTKIRKISGWILLALVAINIAVLALFFFGGLSENATPTWKEYNFTSELLYWMYIIFALAIIALLAFGLFQFVTSLMTNPKTALASLSVLVVFAALLGITYSIGDPTPIASITNADIAKYNVPMWLKVSDMWIYSMYILLILCVVAVFATQLRKVFTK